MTDAEIYLNEWLSSFLYRIINALLIGAPAPHGAAGLLNQQEASFLTNMPKMQKYMHRTGLRGFFFFWGGGPGWTQFAAILGPGTSLLRTTSVFRDCFEAIDSAAGADARLSMARDWLRRAGAAAMPPGRSTESTN